MIKWLVTLKKKNGSKYLVLDDVDENKEASQNMKKFGTELKKKLKRLMVLKTWIWERFKKKLGLNLMMICQWINL